PAVPSPGTRPASRPAGVGPVENPLESRPPFASASGASPTGRAALEDARLLVSARASVPAVAERGPELEAPARGGLPLTAARAEPIERTVVVHIGEIEIHGAEPPVAPAPPAAATPAPPASASAGFDDYAGLRSYTPWER
ncbi:MAG TPA: hypothetical protein VFW96_01855, partial [Thermomicrobiales bacterium]|nr:hypothetical protein [Thermomicrobiales bacterium]